MNAAGYRSKQTIAIIGGGVIGLSIGWRIAQAGVQVEIFERGRAGQAASWAAAGMLAAASEVEPGESALFALSHRSQKLWPDFAAEIAAASGIDVQLRTRGHSIDCAQPRRPGQITPGFRSSEKPRHHIPMVQPGRGAGA